jgi:hypothetical protein
MSDSINSPNDVAVLLGSARILRAGCSILPQRTFREARQPYLPFEGPGKFVAVEHRDQHVERVRYPRKTERSCS